MTVKRSGRELRWAAGPPARARSGVAHRWFVWRSKRVRAEPPSRPELETGVAEMMVTEIPRPGPVLTEHPLEREWNIWDLERRAREQARDATRDQEWAALFMHLRQFASADGVLPTQFDGLVRESFSRLIQAA
jgi:hypothetical protein